MNSGDRFGDLLKELEGCKWDAILLSETRKKREMGAGGFNHKHGVGILLNERWKRKIVKTEYVSERIITTTMKYLQRRIELASVYFSHAGYTEVHIEKMYKCIENHCNKKHTAIIADDFNAQLGPGDDSESDYVGPNKRGIWMKQGLMIQNYVVPKTTFKNVSEEQTAFRSASGKDKQLDDVLSDKRSRRYCTDAEANDMIHLGSDHRSVTAHFQFPCGKKKGALNNEGRNQRFRESTRCKRQATSIETSQDHDSTERIHEIER